LILPEILSVINSWESGFSRILKSEGGYWFPETLVEQSKTQNEHGSGTQIASGYLMYMPLPLFLMASTADPSV
jgi:hypothetical protein